LTQEPRHLIISSDLKTWKFEQPVLFLGKWCLREQDRHIWEKMDAIIAKPIGEENNERYSLHLEARRIEHKLFPKLVDVLNEHHGFEHSQRYWKIILGHWLREVVQLLLNRIKTIEMCLDQNKIASITLYEFPKSNLTANEYGDIWKQSMTNSWNAEVYERILEHLQVRDIAIERIVDSINENNEKLMPTVVVATKIPIEKRIYKKTRQIVDTIARELASKIGSEKDAFIINSYLPPEKELLLNFALGQFPQRRTTSHFEGKGKIDKEFREKLSQRMKLTQVSKEEGIIASLLMELIPTNYLEDYKSLVEATELLKWPKEPKFIFTSNNFVADEVFKVWTAEKVNKGTPYIVGQHGNRYGTHKLNEMTIEEVTSDRFLTWGWNRGLPQHTPAFIFKNASKAKKGNSQSTGLLLLEDNPVARFEVWEQADEFEKYMKEQFKFASGLAKEARENLVVRLHPAYLIMQGEGDIRWRNFDRNIKLDLGKTPIRELWFNNRLIVHGYDSTGILETLEANRPTLAFWQNGLNHLVEEAIPFYELLIDAGIVHLTSESAAAKINEVWGDVNNWWQNSEVQNAREIFCHEYARTSKKPIRDLKKLLLIGI
jgi:putative transferase (TIGR04331 family)